jgi:hypothetical protein
VQVISGKRCYTIVGVIQLLHNTRHSHLFLGLITFYLGILTLIIALLTYVAMMASKPTKIVMSLVVAFTLLPTTYFIFVRPLFEQSERAPTSLPVDREIEMDERASLSSASTAPRMPEPQIHKSTPSVGYVNVTMPQPPAPGPVTPS